MTHTEQTLVDRLRAYAQDWRERAASKEIVDEAAAELTTLTADRDKLAAEVERLIEALKPFAELGGLMTDADGWSDNDELRLEADPHFGSFATVKAGDFRRACQAQEPTS